MPPKKTRLSLTKAQSQAGVGAELLALCQTATADGVLTDAEVFELRGWLDLNRGSDLPAIEFLVSTLERILADGVVTPEERKELYGAIEKVLPPEARKNATTQRKAVEAAEKAETKRAKEEEQRQAKEAREAQRQKERARQRPVFYMNFMVAGVHYEGRPQVIRLFVYEGDRVFLARDPGNRFSRNAIEVRLASGMMIGYVPEEFAPDAAPFLDAGHPHIAYVTKVLRGGRVPIPVVQADLHRPDSDAPELTFPSGLPAKQPPPTGEVEEQDERDDGRPIIRARPVRAVKTGCALALTVVCAPAVAVATARVLGVFG